MITYSLRMNTTANSITSGAMDVYTARVKSVCAGGSFLGGQPETVEQTHKS